MKGCFGVLIITAGLALSHLHAAPLVTRVVTSSDLPDFDTIAGLSANSPVVIGANGHVLFFFNNTSARLQIYRWSNGVFSPFLADNGTAAGLNGATIWSLVGPGHVDRGGRITSGAVLSFPDASNVGAVLRGSPGFPAAASIAADSSRMPFSSIQTPFVSDGGIMALLVSVPNGGTSESWIVTGGPGGSPVPVLKSGDPVPVAIDEEDPNKTIALIREIAIDNSGRIGCIIRRNAFGDFGMILSGSGSSWVSSARIFEPAPGTEDDFKHFDEITVSNGFVAFTATTSRGVNGQTGVWRASGGSAQLIAIGAEAFGDAEGTRVTGGTLFTARLPLLADTGACYLRASLVVGNGVDVTNNDLILLHNGSSLRTVIREGDPAPGLPSGEGWRIVQLPERFVINPLGRLAMIANARSASGTTEKWLWVGGQDGLLEPIMKIGDTIGGKPISDIHLFTGFESAGGNPTGRSNADGKPGPFNAAGQLVVGVRHPDENAIYILDFSKSNTVASRFQLGDPVVTPSAVAFPFSGQQGKQYRLERSDASFEWHPVGEMFNGEDVRVFLTDTPPAGSDTYFYRVLRLP